MATGRPNGRPPKPIEVKIAEGNKGNRKLPQTQLGLRDDNIVIPEPPVKDPLFKKIWASIWQISHLNPAQDFFVVQLFAESWVEYIFLTSEISKADKLVAKEGNLALSKRVYVNPNGTMQTHSYWTQRKEIKVQLNTYMSSLGLSPADRARLQIAADAEAEKEELKKLTRRNVTEV